MRVLLVCRQAQLSEALMEVLKQLTVEDINIVSSCSEGRRLLGEKGYDLVMINTPLNDEFGTGTKSPVVGSVISVTVSRRNSLDKPPVSEPISFSNLILNGQLPRLLKLLGDL